jgi:carbonic anhydrase/acetyltransferase-like protein (isoleucine patch superfamily)
VRIVELGASRPRIEKAAFIAEDAVLIGDVELGEDASVWFKCVLRADVGRISIGARTNVQDMVCVHMTDSLSNTVVGDDVTIGHGAILHGATIESGALVGMGAILLDNVVVGAESVVAAGSVVPPRMVIPAGSMVRGSPAKVVRLLTDEERQMGKQGAVHYVENARRYRALGVPTANPTPGEKPR